MVTACPVPSDQFLVGATPILSPMFHPIRIGLCNNFSVRLLAFTGLDNKLHVRTSSRPFTSIRGELWAKNFVKRSIIRIGAAIS
mmetsp:Transcript_49214/g.49562  ORF Transcript_49214/g.49562 Transcript_49214/m.49562 type:complete len:84 (-) Transcript_49214:9-260(-)